MLQAVEDSHVKGTVADAQVVHDHAERLAAVRHLGEYGFRLECCWLVAEMTSAPSEYLGGDES